MPGVFSIKDWVGAYGLLIAASHYELQAGSLRLA
jgi:hypothetical protein